MSKQILELRRVGNGHIPIPMNIWNNDYMYDDGGAHFWCEIAEFLHPTTKGIFRVWIIETPDGKFSHNSKQDGIRHFCTGFNDGLTLQQAKILMDLKVSKFMNCLYETKLIESVCNIPLPISV